MLSGFALAKKFLRAAPREAVGRQAGCFLIRITVAAWLDFAIVRDLLLGIVRTLPDYPPAPLAPSPCYYATPLVSPIWSSPLLHT
jgi:hypothetical protein